MSGAAVQNPQTSTGEDGGGSGVTIEMRAGGTGEVDFGVAWLAFVKSAESLLELRSKQHRHLKEFDGFQQAVLKIVRDKKFVSDLSEGWIDLKGKESEDVANALLLEVELFPKAAAVAAQGSPKRLPGWVRRLLGGASTVAGSVKDILEDLAPYTKNGITLFKELMDISKEF
ncbi:hypothetical protein [Mariprofundus sp. KV]|uniref:hypothetical protein n=1 Tax=Mariprofundus sp. KV TaxID=2608715 RepID=UPI0015A10B97|nr:hypothetical protein [Mariprofundus sp. KV]NWF35770.1 hypothetical protein [Mariprofundus sp. KV]